MAARTSSCVAASVRCSLVGSITPGMLLRFGQQTLAAQTTFRTSKRAAPTVTLFSRAMSSSSSSLRSSQSIGSFWSWPSSSSAWKKYYLMAALPLAIFSLDTRQPGLSLVAEEPRRPISPRRYQLPLNPEEISQVSKGSFSGFVAGLLVAFFSRTLVFLLGVAITFQTVASKVGIDVARYLKLKDYATTSRVLESLAKNTAFKLAFGITFTLAAFAHF